MKTTIIGLAIPSLRTMHV